MILYQLYQTLEEYQNSTGSADLATVFCYNNSIIPFMAIVVLVPLFFIILLSTLYGTKRATGRFDFPASFAVASFIDVIGATILSLAKCGGTNLPLVDTPVLIICIAIFIVSVIILFLNRD
jgi:hypothetical protein